ncbi:MAG: hypothetical protein ACODAE_01265, partial [Gemmatimonadota bacterium]
MSKVLHRRGAGSKPAAHAALPARDAYRLWARTYDEAETAVSALDELAVRRLTPPLDGLTLLDAACGTGRRLPATNATKDAGRA